MNIQRTDTKITNIVLDVPPKFRRGIIAKQGKTHESILSGFETFRYVAELLDIPNFADYDILDFGCGVKSSQAILQFELPVKSYLGLDIDQEMIAYLQQEVKSPQLNYKTVPFASEFYQKEGQSMSPDFATTQINKKFDLIIIQSVFIHFTKAELESCLQMLKNLLKPGGKVFFTCLLGQLQEEDVKDLVPDSPLMKVSFKEAYMFELLKKAGLAIDSYHRRKTHRFFPEHLICSLIPTK